MSWRQKLQWSSERGKASFRGAVFYVDMTDTGVGRRTEMHVYPNTNGKWQDYVWAQDLGPEPQEFVVEGYVIQNLSNGLDHFIERDKLITALQTQGPGELIHPFYGKMRVSLMGKARIRESLSNEQGIARFSMTFAQYNEPIFKQQETDFVNIVDTSALSTINAALDGFTDLMNTVGAFVSSLTDPITATMNKMQDAVNSVNGAVASTISAALNTIATAISLVDTLLTSPCALANQILNAADAVLGLVGMAGEVVQGGIVGGCSSVRRGDTTIMNGKSIPEFLGNSVVNEMSSSASFDSDDIKEETGRLPEEQSNNLELAINTAQSMMLANITKIAIRVEYSSFQQMEGVIETVTDAIDNLIDRLGAVGVDNDNIDDIDDPVLFSAVSDLRSKFVKSMYGKYTDIAKEYDYECPSQVNNALSLAYDKYEDLDRFDEIFNRNRVSIKHPGFLPSGDNIKLLDS